MAMNKLLNELNAVQLTSSQLTSSLRIAENELKTAQLESERMKNSLDGFNNNSLAVSLKQVQIRAALESAKVHLQHTLQGTVHERDHHLVLNRDILNLKDELTRFQEKSSPGLQSLKEYSAQLRKYTNLNVESISETSSNDEDCMDQKSDVGASSSSPMRKRVSSGGSAEVSPDGSAHASVR